MPELAFLFHPLQSFSFMNHIFEIVNCRPEVFVNYLEKCLIYKQTWVLLNGYFHDLGGFNRYDSNVFGKN